MAITVDEITAVVNDLYLDAFPQFIAYNAPFLRVLRENGETKQGGNRIKLDLLYQANKGGFYNKYERFNFDAEQNITATYFDWRQMYVPITYAGIEALQVEGPEEAKSFIDAKVRAASIRAAEILMSAFLKSGAPGAAEMESLEHLLDDTTLVSSDTSFGTLDKSTETWLKGNVVDLGGATAAPTYANIMKGWVKAADDGMNPDLILMGNNAFGSYLAMEAQKVQYIKTDEADTGFSYATFNTQRVIFDRHVPEATVAGSRMFVLSMPTIDFIRHRSDDMKMSPFSKLQDRDVYVATITLTGNLVCTKPRDNAIIHNFDATKVV